MGTHSPVPSSFLKGKQSSASPASSSYLGTLLETRKEIGNNTAVMLVEAVNNYMVREEETVEDIALLNVLCHITGYCGKSAARYGMCRSCANLLIKEDNGFEPSQVNLVDKNKDMKILVSHFFFKYSHICHCI